MPALREIIARYAVDVDSRPLDSLDKQLRASEDRFNKIANAAAVGFAAAGFAAVKFIGAASAVEEQMNVVNETFGKEGAQRVTQWADAVGDAMGRSKFALADAAGRFGAFLEPQFRGTSTDIARISTQLSELAIDLGSFYNISDQEAQMRLFSGLSGETEAVRRLGVDISDTALDAFNKAGKAADRFGERGAEVMKKPIAALTLQEKTLIRYAKILADTELKQGDAIRTANSWENSLKRVSSKLEVLSVDMGKKLIPSAKKALTFFEDKMLPGLESLAKHTDVVADSTTAAGLTFVGFKFAAWQAARSAHAVEQAMKAGATAEVAAAAGLAANNFGAMAKSMWKVTYPLAAILGGVLLLEDAIGLLTGKDSVLGTAIEDSFGIGDATQAALGTLDNITVGAAQAIKNLGIAASGGTPVLIGDAVAAFQREEQEKMRAAQQMAVETGDIKLFQKNKTAVQTPAEANQEYIQRRNRYLGDKEGNAEDITLGLGAANVENKRRAAAAQQLAPSSAVSLSKPGQFGNFVEQKFTIVVSERNLQPVTDAVRAAGLGDTKAIQSITSSNAGHFKRDEAD